MAVSTVGENGFGGDPFEHVDYQTAMALVESHLEQRIGAIAKKEQRGMIGACRLQLQKLLPRVFGTAITPARAHQLFATISASHDVMVSQVPSGPEDGYDLAKQRFSALQSIALTWSDRDLRRYLNEPSRRVDSQQGSLAFAIAALWREDAERRSLDAHKGINASSGADETEMQF